MNKLQAHIYNQLAIRFPMALIMVVSWCVTLLIQLFFQPETLKEVQFNPVFLPMVKAFSQTFCIGIPLFILIAISHYVYAPKLAKVWVYLIGAIILSMYSVNLLFFKSFELNHVLIKQEFFMMLAISLLSVSFVPFFKFVR